MRSSHRYPALTHSPSRQSTLPRSSALVHPQFYPRDSLACLFPLPTETIDRLSSIHKVQVCGGMFGPKEGDPMSCAYRAWIGASSAKQGVSKREFEVVDSFRLLPSYISTNRMLQN